MYDIIIIGGGPAGISSSLYTVRGGLSTAVIYKDDGALGKSELIENYYGFPGGIDGGELIARGREQAKTLGAELIDAQVVGIEMADGLMVHTTTGTLSSKAVIIATGSERKKLPDIGIEKYEGAGVSYCAVCDGYFYRGKEIAVIGSGEYALSEATDISNFASKVTVFTGGGNPEADFGEFEIVTGGIETIFGDGRVEGIRLADGSEIPVSGVFVAVGTAGTADIAAKTGIMSERGYITVDSEFATNVPGIFAAGDCTGGFAQVSKAVGDGAMAAKSAIGFVRKQSSAKI